MSDEKKEKKIKAKRAWRREEGLCREREKEREKALGVSERVELWFFRGTRGCFWEFEVHGVWLVCVRDDGQ